MTSWATTPRLGAGNLSADGALASLRATSLPSPGPELHPHQKAPGQHGGPRPGVVTQGRKLHPGLLRLSLERGPLHPRPQASGSSRPGRRPDRGRGATSPASPCRPPSPPPSALLPRKRAGRGRSGPRSAPPRPWRTRRPASAATSAPFSGTAGAPASSAALEARDLEAHRPVGLGDRGEARSPKLEHHVVRPPLHLPQRGRPGLAVLRPLPSRCRRGIPSPEPSPPPAPPVRPPPPPTPDRGASSGPSSPRPPAGRSNAGPAHRRSSHA